MTFYAHRHNVQPVLFSIAFMVVVVLGLFATGTVQSIDSRQFTGIDSFLYGSSCVTSFSVSRIVLFMSNFVSFVLPITFIAVFGFFASIIMAHIHFTFFCFIAFFLVFALASFTFRPITVSFAAVFVKISEWFNSFAFGTSFGYDLLSHNRFSSKRLCLEPVAAQTAVGSSYSISRRGNVNYFYENF